MSEMMPPAVIRFLADTADLTRGIQESEGRLSAMNRTLSMFGKASAAALVVAGAESVHLASQFQAAMERVHTQAGASQQEVDALKNSVLGLAGKTGQAPEQLAEGLYHLESAGFRGAKAMDILNNAAKLAAIGNANLEDVTQAMIATVASGIPGVKDMSDAAALLNTTVGIGDMKMQQLTKAIATGILPSARVAGLSFNDVAAALATVTDNATPADETATRLRMTISLMAAPSGAAAKALKTIHMSSTEMANDMHKPNGLLVALQDLKSHLDSSGMSAAEQAQVLQKSFGGGKTSGTIMLLMTQMDRLKDKYGELGNSTERAAAFQDSWAATQKTFKNEVDRLRASAEALGVKLGTWLIPKLEAMARFFSDHQDITKGIVVALGALMAISIAVWLGNLGYAAGKAVFAVGKLAWSIGGELVKQLALAVWEVAKFVAELVVDTVQAAAQAAFAVGKLAVSIGVNLVKQVGLAIFAMARFVGELVVDTVQAAAKAAVGIGRLAAAMAVQLARAAVTAARAMASFTVSLLTNPVFLIVAAVVALVVGIYELWTHWDQVWKWIMHHKAYAALIAWLFPILIPIFAIVAAAKYLQKHWKEIWATIQSDFKAVWDWIKHAFDDFVGAIDWVGNKISNLIRDIGRIGSAVAHPVAAVGHMLGFAAGGSPPVGRAVLVGEQGPELAVFGAPAYVHPAGATRSILAGGKAGGGWVGDSGSWVGGGSGSTTAAGQPPDIVLQVDGQTLFRIVQKQALQRERRNLSNGLSALVVT